MVDTKWLRSLGEDGLAALLERRPDVVAAPLPESLAEVAARLDSPPSVIAALRGLDLPTVQLVEALAALGGWATRPALDRLLGVPERADPVAVDAALQTLRDAALLLPAPSLALADTARRVVPQPLGLGPPAAALLEAYTAENLKSLAQRLGLRPAGRKAELFAAVLGALSDHERVRAVVAAGPAAAREMLIKVAVTGDEVYDYAYFSPRYAADDTPQRWAQARGLLLREQAWGGRLVMPAEVGLALRGEDYVAPFEPVPPRVPRATVAAEHAERAERAATAAGAAALRLVTGMLDEASRAPLAQLKNGGIGVREARRLGKALGFEVADVKLALSLAHGAGLLDLSADTVAPTARYDEWLRSEPADRLAGLLAAWWRLRHAPMTDPDGAWAPGGHGDTAVDAPAVPALRAILLAEVAAVPGTAVTSPGEVVEAVLWRRPFAYRGDDVVEVLVACWLEAVTVGALAEGAVSAAGRALLSGDDAALRAALAGVGTVVRTVRIQGDLTAVVTGTPAADLADLLDAVADRESVGAATTWRFSPASVRRAYDTGWDADRLLAALTEVSVSALPQPLDYLARDVARRHGAVRLSEVACCLRSDDAALLAEIAADRRLRHLRLRVLAPTVLAAGRPLAETLTALRGAGYAPLAETADGTPVLERAKRHRAQPAAEPRPARSRPASPAPQPTRPADVARHLLALPDQPLGVSATLAAVKGAARHLPEVEARVLARAIDEGGVVQIDYVNAEGNDSVRDIEPVEIFGDILWAWCRLRQDERQFALRRVMGVRPAAG